MHPLLDKTWKEIFPVFFIFNKEKPNLDTVQETLRNSIKFTNRESNKNRNTQNFMDKANIAGIKAMKKFETLTLKNKQFRNFMKDSTKIIKKI
jgi:hypothetical protein